VQAWRWPDFEAAVAVPAISSNAMAENALALVNIRGPVRKFIFTTLSQTNKRSGSLSAIQAQLILL
jgi:hypothetical protein